MRVYRQGMTLIEIVITASIIGLLAAFILPAVVKSMERRENGLCASKMRIAVNAFELYFSEEGEYPPDVNRSIVPSEMVDYFVTLGIDWWTELNELGAAWDWDKDNNFAYSVSFVDPDSSVSEKQLVEFDALMDDGDLTTGNLRRVGSRYHYILEE